MEGQQQVVSASSCILLTTCNNTNTTFDHLQVVHPSWGRIQPPGKVVCESDRLSVCLSVCRLKLSCRQVKFTVSAAPPALLPRSISTSWTPTYHTLHTSGCWLKENAM